MRRDWLLYLVIFSLALNFGTIGTFAYLHWQDQQEVSPPKEEVPLPFRKMLRELNLDQQQRQSLRSLVPEHRRRVRELLQELAQQRRELFALLKQENLPPWPPVQTKIQEIGGLQIRLEEEKVQHLLEVQKNLKPEQRQLLMIHLEKRLSPFWSRHGRHGGMRGFQHGPPPPPREPPCPPAPPGLR
ncbi:MAG: periplasmic heavy metal sensor [Syntrophobacterales bacterium]|jgi:Spy/CpxP family protein refolding chaperone